MKYPTYLLLAFLVVTSCKDDSTATTVTTPEKTESSTSEEPTAPDPQPAFSESPHLTAINLSRQSPPPLSAWGKARKRLNEMLRQDAPIQGIDVSKWQDKINWKEIKLDEMSFAICKAT